MLVARSARAVVGQASRVLPKTNIFKKVVEQLKAARLEAGLTQVEVSQKLKRPQSYISKIERGERRVDVVELTEIAEIYQKPIAYFT